LKKTEEIVEIEGRTLALSNLDKPMWKKEGITKSDHHPILSVGGIQDGSR